jgi:hypothetical protein
MNEELMKKILKSLYDGNQPNHEDYDVTEEVWRKTAAYLKNEGYITGITISNNTKYMFVELTEKGRDFVKNEVSV